MLPTHTRRVVVKLGTGVLTQGIGLLHRERVETIASQIADYRAKGLEVIIVSSGAVGLGMGRLGLTKKPSRLTALQKCAAVGQSQLMETWQQAFNPHKIIVGQLLLTRHDVTSRDRHLAAKALLEELLSDGIIPVINENDSTTADELKFGDNDLLSAMVATMVQADILIILSTATGLVNTLGDQQIIPIVDKVTAEIEELARGTTDVTATGGMVTKLQAARMATLSGCSVFIGSGESPDILTALYAGKAIGTLFKPSETPMISRKSWIAFFHKPNGKIIIDAGASDALTCKGASLLSTGVTGTDGSFKRGDVVAIAKADGAVVAQGIVEFGSEDLQKIIGQHSKMIQQMFPKQKKTEIVHRNSMVILD